MKNFLKVFIVTAGLILYFNVSSFAIADVAGWVGAFKGDGANGYDTQGAHFGFKAHYNLSLTPLFDLGVGGYFQHLRLTYSDLKVPLDDLKRDSAGLDLNLIALPSPVIHPYLRGTWAFWDKIEAVRYPHESRKSKFKPFGLGLGVEFAFFPFIRLFGEYMFDKTKYDDVKFTSNLFNLGLKLDF